MSTIETLPTVWPTALDALVAPRESGAVYPGTLIELVRSLREDGINIDFTIQPDGFTGSRHGEYTAPAFIFTEASLSGGIEVLALTIQATIGELKLTRTRLDVAVYVYTKGEPVVVFEGAGPALPVLTAMRAAGRARRRPTIRRSA